MPITRAGGVLQVPDVEDVHVGVGDLNVAQVQAAQAQEGQEHGPRPMNFSPGEGLHLRPKGRGGSLWPLRRACWRERCRAACCCRGGCPGRRSRDDGADPLPRSRSASTMVELAHLRQAGPGPRPPCPASALVGLRAGDLQRACALIEDQRWPFQPVDAQAVDVVALAWAGAGRWTLRRLRGPDLEVVQHHDRPLAHADDGVDRRRLSLGASGSAAPSGCATRS